MLIDYVKIAVKAGNGGNGAISFRREKYVANGGPDGGDGGKGGDVYIKVDNNTSTLLDFRYTKKFNAQDGKNGDGANRTGKSGEDLYISVPAGTIIKDIKKNKIIADLSHEGQEILIAKGGKGGKGNQHFATSTRQVPNFAEQGLDGEEKQLELELKMIADVGIIGFPNVGKSTIISVVSSAKPKIANYDFTTLEPNLGVVKTRTGKTFVIADIPGIIEGASEGIGLGLKFLKHVERTRLLLHVLDISASEGRNPIDDYRIINLELKKYSEKLAEKKQIIVANKIDSMVDDTYLKELEKICKNDKLKLFKTSAATNKGLDELMDYLAEELETIPKPELIEVENEENEINLKDQIWNVEKTSDGFKIYGAPIERLMKKVNVYDIESRQYMQLVLKSLGVMKKLQEMGLKNGDVLDIVGYQMDYSE